MTTHDRQFCAPHTGMIYTAPHASDHIAVSVLLDDAAIAQPLSLSLDEPTKACSFRPGVLLRAQGICAGSERWKWEQQASQGVELVE